jgi:hypothetical protein
MANRHARGPIGDPALAAEVVWRIRRVRGQSGSGTPIEAGARARLERGLRADLGLVRVHRDEDAAWLCAVLGTDAVASGADVFQRPDAPRPDTAAGLWLLAHEAAHTVQQSGRQVLAGAAERAADAAADRVLAGRPGAGRHAMVSPPDPGDPVLVQRHASWEHRLLGEIDPAQLDAIARGAPERLEILKNLRAYLKLWYKGPDGVTPERIRQFFDDITLFRLPDENGSVLATYGELNTLPDYMADPLVQGAQPGAMLLQILQAVRQEGYNKVDQLLGGKEQLSFTGAVAINSGWSFLDLLYETKALNDLTWDIGPEHTNHYTALVARNACHFAPYSWHRWRRAYDRAVEFAQRSYASRDERQKAYYFYEAWIHHGYADHFLQDSFAAGHLVNKTLIMQWFLEWAATRIDWLVYDWTRVKTMTVSEQPGLAAWQLYDWKDPGTVRDPQTAEEEAEQWDRMQVSGVQKTTKLTQGDAYQNYLAFLNSTVVQSSSGALHDYFNKQSLTVASLADNDPYQIWGDDTMLNGGDGVRIASSTAKLSRRSLEDHINTGDSPISAQQIIDHFPFWVQVDGSLISLAEWNQGLRNLAMKQFPTVHYLLLRAYPQVKYVSVDWNKPYQPGWRAWAPAGADALKAQPGAPVTAVWGPQGEHLRLFTTAPNGAVMTTGWSQEFGWDPWSPAGDGIVAPGTDVTAVWRGTHGDHLDLFASGADGVVRSTYWQPGIGWQKWFPVQADTRIYPGAKITAVWQEGGDTHLDLFATGVAGTVLSTYWEIESGWVPWFTIEDQKVTPGTSVTAVWRAGAPHLDLFASTNDGSVLTAFWEPGSGWQPWFAVAEQSDVATPTAAVAAVWSTPNHLDLLTIGKDTKLVDGTVKSAAWDLGRGWQPWYAVQPDAGRAYLGLRATATAVRSGNDKYTDVFTTGPDGTVKTTFRGTGAEWFPWFGIHPETKMFPGAVVAAVWRDADRLDLFVSGIDGTVLTNRWAPPMPTGTGHLGLPQ